MTREEIIRNLEYTMEKHKNDTVNTFGTNISVMCKDILDYLEQEPETGHWIVYDVHGHKACKCSECDKDVGYPCNYKYCPYCGERMVESKELSE